MNCNLEQQLLKLKEVDRDLHWRFLVAKPVQKLIQKVTLTHPGSFILASCTQTHLKVSVMFYDLAFN